MKTLKKLTPFIITASPLLTYARTEVQDIVKRIGGILDYIIPILMVLATVVFLWGVIQYVLAGGDEEKRKQGRSLIIYGLIGLFVMVAVWGIVKILVQTFLGGAAGGGVPGGPLQPGAR